MTSRFHIRLLCAFSLAALATASLPANADITYAAPDVINQGQVKTFTYPLYSNFTSNLDWDHYDPTGSTGSEIHIIYNPNSVIVTTQISVNGFVQPSPVEGAFANVWSIFSFKVTTPTTFSLNYSGQVSSQGNILSQGSFLKVYSSSGQSILDTGLTSGTLQFSAVPGVYYTLENRHYASAAGNKYVPDGGGGIVLSSVMSLSTVVPEPSSVVALASSLLCGMGVLVRGRRLR